MLTSSLVNTFEPLLSLEIEPRTRADHQSLEQGVQSLMSEDAMFRVQTDAQTGRTTIFGMGELQLAIIVDRLEREFNVQATVGQPRVAYKSALTRHADGEGRYVGQTGGRGQYGHVKIHLYPGTPGAGCVFENEISSGSIPEAYIKPIEEGIREALGRGALSGFSITDVRIELCDGSYHDIDSSDAAFRIAAAMALADATTRAQPVWLEPIMRVEVVAPNDCRGDVARSLTSRRGRIESQEERGGATIVAARVALSEMLGYAATLRSQTHGRATYSMSLDGYEARDGGSAPDDGDRSAPVTAPRRTGPSGRDSAIALPEPDDQGFAAR
jgi:elongation factor G